MEEMKINKGIWTNVIFAIALIVFTFIVFHLTVGWFTIVMSLFATGIFVLILLYGSEDEDLDKPGNQKNKSNS